MKSRFSVPVRPVSSLDDFIQGIEQSVRIRAFERYNERGRQPGRELEDWQNASAELLHQPQSVLSETEFQTTVEFRITDEELRDCEVLASEHAILLISKSHVGGDGGPQPRTYKLVSLQRPIDTQSLRAEFNNGKLFCAANATQDTSRLKATA